MSLSLDYNTIHNIPKPTLPYSKGTEFDAIEHVPPPPQVKPAYSLTRSEIKEREQTDVLTRCISKTPISGKLGVLRLTFRILGAVRVGDDKSSQLVLVEIISGHLSGHQILAKIYDPLYYDHSDDGVDPFLYVDVEYTRETAAYHHLGKHEGEDIPKFYGSYSININHGDRGSRTVRLILLEYVAGDSMDSLQASDFPQSIRKCIMEQVVNRESRLYQIDLRHNDTCPRNIIIQGLQDDKSELRILFIDFGHSIIGRSPHPGDATIENQFLPGVYISPILRWWLVRGKEPVRSFEEWIDWC